jgi:hypothetical protein
MESNDRRNEVQTIANSRDEIIGRIEAAIVAANMEWQSGRMTSPSELDYVIDARKIMGEYEGFIGVTCEGENFVADVLSEDAGETYVTERDVAVFLYDQLSAE